MTNCLFTAHANAVFNAFFWFGWGTLGVQSNKNQSLPPTEQIVVLSYTVVEIITITGYDLFLVQVAGYLRRS